MPTPYNSNSQREEIEKVRASNIQLKQEGFEEIDLGEPAAQTKLSQDTVTTETTQDKKTNVLNAIRENDSAKVAVYSQDSDYQQVFEKSGAEFLKAAQVSDKKIKQNPNLTLAEKDEKRTKTLLISNSLQDVQPLKENSTWEKIKLFFSNIIDSVFPSRKTPDTTLSSPSETMPLLQNDPQKNYGTFISSNLSVSLQKEDLNTQMSTNQKKNRDSFQKIGETLAKQAQNIQDASSEIGPRGSTPSSVKSSQGQNR